MWLLVIRSDVAVRGWVVSARQSELPLVTVRIHIDLLGGMKVTGM